MVLASRFSAAAFGVEGRALSLRKRAEQLVGADRLASRLDVRRSRLSAVRAEPTWSELARRDATGYARIGTTAITELLRYAELGSPPAQLDARVARWWAIAQRHRQQLADAGQIDPAELLLAAARMASTPSSAATAFLGFLNPHLDELELMNAMAGPGSLLVLPDAAPWTDAQGPARRWLRDRGFVEERVAAGRPSEPPQRAAFGFASREAEVEQVVAELKSELLAGVAAAELAVAVTDMSLYAQALAGAAFGAGIPLRFERFVPVVETAAGAAAALYLDAVQTSHQHEPDAETLLAWLAHPRVALIDADTLSRARREPPRSRSEWRRLAAGLELLSWPAQATPARWRALLAGGWRQAGLVPMVDPATLAPLAAGDEHNNPNPFDDPHLAEAWEEGLSALDALCDPGGSVARDEVIATLRDVLSAESVYLGGSDEDTQGERAQGAEPISVFDLSLIGSQRRSFVALLGAVDGLTPKVLREDPILGSSERRELMALGLPIASIGDLGRAEQLSFWGAVAAAERRLWIGVPAQIGRDGYEASPFVERLGLTPNIASTHPPIASANAFLSAALRHRQIAVAHESRLEQARRAHAQTLQRETSSSWSLDDGLMGVEVDEGGWTWSATSLRDLGSCRFRWWVKSFLEVKEIEEAERTLTPLLEGRLLHKALEHTLQAALGLQGAEARAAAQLALEAGYAEAEREVEVAKVVQHWEKRRAEPLAHLRLLLDHPEMFPAGSVIVELEHKFHGVWRGWPIRGYVDRIDRTATGLRLTDYKLGSSAGATVRDSELKPGLDLQLPIYTEVAAAAFATGLDDARIEAQYMSMRKVELLDAEPPPEEELEDLFRRLRASLRAGFFPPEPDDNICRTCSHDLICRKGSHLALKELPYLPPGDASAGGPA